MVKNQTRVVVYGRSLPMAGIAASLKADAGLEVLCVDPHSPTARQSLREIGPQAVAFDLNDRSPGLDVTLLRGQPGLLLVGVDLSNDELLVLSSRPQQALNMADLADAIRQVE